MSPRSSAARAYAAVGTHGRVTETDSHGLILLLFEGALERIDLARAAIQRGDVPAKAEAITKAMRIVESLRASLNMDAGGGLAAKLDELYEFCGRRLLVANARGDASVLDEARDVLLQLRSGWAGLAARG
jgi:flagellar protein FliS